MQSRCDEVFKLPAAAGAGGFFRRLDFIERRRTVIARGGPQIGPDRAGGPCKPSGASRRPGGSAGCSPKCGTARAPGAGPGGSSPHGPKGRNPRFIVTNLDGQAKALYERVYCQRGKMENRIKEQQLCRPHLEPPVVDESISGGARGPGLYPARDDAPHGTARHGPCPSAMPNPATTASEARRGGDPKYPHRRGAAVEHLPRPSVVPAPGAPAHCRIARGERAVTEKGVPGPPGPARYARGHRHGSKTLSRDRVNCSGALSEATSGQSPPRICAAKCPITSKNSPFVQYPGLWYLLRPACARGTAPAPPRTAPPA